MKKRILLRLALLLILFVFPGKVVKAAGPAMDVSVSATVRLSDYFAQLLAADSLVSLEIQDTNQVLVQTEIIATDGLRFGDHPLRIDLFRPATTTMLTQTTAITNLQGVANFHLDLAGQVGLFKIVVTDLAYERPIPLDRQPLVLITETNSRIAVAQGFGPRAAGEAGSSLAQRRPVSCRVMVGDSRSSQPSPLNLDLTDHCRDP